MLGLGGAPYEQPRQGNMPRSTPTYYIGGHMYVHCKITTPRWGVTHSIEDLGYVLVVLNVSVPKIITA